MLTPEYFMRGKPRKNASEAEATKKAYLHAAPKSKMTLSRTPAIRFVFSFTNMPSVPFKNSAPSPADAGVNDQKRPF
jgi:hypothetical protein